MTDAVEFTRADIEELLTALAARLEAQGVAATVYLVGGAAIALRGISSDRRTADVDALMLPEEQVLAAARQVAAERGIRSTWLNSAVRPYVPPLPETLQPPPGPGLQIRTAPDDHLLAMKLIAARGQRDMRDIIPLTRRLGLDDDGAFGGRARGAPLVPWTYQFVQFVSFCWPVNEVASGYGVFSSFSYPFG